MMLCSSGVFSQVDRASRYPAPSKAAREGKHKRSCDEAGYCKSSKPQIVVARCILHPAHPVGTDEAAEHSDRVHSSYARGSGPAGEELSGNRESRRLKSHKRHEARTQCNHHEPAWPSIARYEISGRHYAAGHNTVQRAIARAVRTRASEQHTRRTEYSKSRNQHSHTAYTPASRRLQDGRSRKSVSIDRSQCKKKKQTKHPNLRR